MKNTFTCLLFAFAIIFVFISCEKQRTEKNACSSSPILETDGYCDHFIPFLYLRDVDSVKIFMPNIITPNGDGYNDQIHFCTYCDVTNFSFKIFKRNKIIFEETDNHGEYWDGYYKGVLQTGIFRYEISGQINGESFYFEGEITSIIEDYELVDCENCLAEEFVDPLICNK